jgi:hypothetical protein
MLCASKGDYRPAHRGRGCEDAHRPLKVQVGKESSFQSLKKESSLSLFWIHMKKEIRQDEICNGERFFSIPNEL